MSRSGYIDDGDDQWAMIRWRGAVESAIKGVRGQTLLKELIVALDALEIKRLISKDLIREGEVCALGALGVKRGLDMKDIDPEDRETVANTFGIAPALAAEIMWMNDEWNLWESGEERFRRMRAWILEQIKPEECK